jgi:tetratricopeptide (TPR) repeat protein
LVSDRRELHRRTAAWYERRDPILRAEHLERAEDPAAAAAFLEAARLEAGALHPEVALQLARRGVACAAPGDEAHALAMLQGELARDLGQAGIAVEAFRRAEQHAGSDLARCRAALGIAEAHRLTSAADQGLGVLDAVQPLLESLDAAGERSRAAYLRGCLLFARGDLEHCAQSHRRALNLAREAGDALAEAHAFSGLADVQYAEGRLRSAHASFARCVALAERQRAYRITLTNRNMMGLLGLFLGEIEGSLAALAASRERAREIGHRVAEVMADECIGLVLTGAGRDAEAEPFLQRSLALAREIDSRRFAAIDLALLGLIALRTGAPDQARARLDESDALNEAIGSRFARPIVLGVRARLASSATERERYFAEAETLLAAGTLSHNHLCFREYAIDACLEAGDADGALRHAAALERYASVEPTPWSDFVVARARALARAGTGRDALVHLAERASALGLRRAAPALERAVADGRT